MSSKRFMDWDGDPNMPAYWWHEDGQGDWAQETVQDTTRILDMNAAIRNHCDPWSPDHDIKMTARIPYVILQMWKNLYGIDYWTADPDQQKFIDRILNSNEWWKLRTDEGTL